MKTIKIKHHANKRKIRKVCSKHKKIVCPIKENISRLKNVQLMTRDALEIIDMFDGENTFFFVDPPYVSSDKGHYKKYYVDDFINLLNKLENISGKFLLTSYPEKELEKYVKRNNWKQMIKNFTVSANKPKDGKRSKLKQEVITMNYTINSFFDSYNEILNNS